MEKRKQAKPQLSAREKRRRANQSYNQHLKTSEALRFEAEMARIQQRIEWERSFSFPHWTQLLSGKW